MRIFDTRAGELRDFVPLQPAAVSIYVCGPTVQSTPHIGHLRSALVYDLLASWLEVSGLQVTLVRNVTDIDDKILAGAVSEPWWQLAHRNELAFASDYRRLGIKDCAYEPRATGHITQMLALIDLLIERGHAYQALDGSADVYFDTASWPEYGALTRQSLSDMDSDESNPAKRNPQDFALWKAQKPGEPDSAAWPSRFGAGRPGWHIECSAMATHYLGESFDIHGGGLDLRFPHHENELAQSAAAGHGFARYWMHNGLVNVGGQKMSKSLGNSVAASDMLALVAPEVVRYYLLSAHYRSVLDYQPAVLSEAESALGRAYSFLERAAKLPQATEAGGETDSSLPQGFVDALNDDLNSPTALAVLHESVRAGNTSLDQDRADDARRLASEVRSMLKVFGLAPEAWRKPSGADGALDTMVSKLIADRNAARAQKDFARADEIRDRLLSAGIELSDDAASTNWSLS